MAAGAQCLHNGVGTLDSLVSMSVPKFVLDAEVIDRLNVMLQGVAYRQEELSLKEIMDVGPHGNHLVTDNTLDNFDCRWSPSISFNDPFRTGRTRELWTQRRGRWCMQMSCWLLSQKMGYSPRQ